MKEGRYNGRGQVLRDIYNAYRKKGKYAPSAVGSKPIEAQVKGEGESPKVVTSSPSPTSKPKPLSG